MARPRDPAATDRILDAALDLVGERGFSAITMDAIATRADVGRPAIYRRFASKADVVVAAIGRALPDLGPAAPPAGADLAEHLRRLVEQATPADPEAYAGLIGGLMAERLAHPELIAAFREQILLPRRAVVRAAIAHGQREGRLRAELDPEVAVDALGGAFLARVFAGRPVTPGWRDAVFDAWWHMIVAEP